MQKWDSPPAMQIDDDAEYAATIDTNCGTITIDLFAADSPKAVNNFVFLAREGYYDDVLFHRVIDGFMVQGGDPTGTGRGGPGYTFSDELDLAESRGYPRGTVAMANAGPDTNGSQFFIVHRDVNLPANYTVFGEVTAGMDAVDEIASRRTDASDKPLDDVRIEAVTVSQG